jgi:hypothetical protein
MNKPAARPFFLFLLPLFFVFHGFVAHARFIRWTDCLIPLGEYLLAACLLFFLFHRVLQDNTKSALVASMILAFCLFFGNLHNWLGNRGFFLHRYSILLPTFLIAVALVARHLAKRPPAVRLARFLNWLFLLFILSDVIVWGIGTRKSPALSATTLLPASGAACGSCPRPDIYLLLFDEYTGSRTLRASFHFDNEGLDSFLRSQNFHIVPDSRSNYNITPFSMASMLNLGYLKGLSHPQGLAAEDYTNIFEPIRKNEVVRFLLSQGYSIVNYSPFDLPEHPSKIQQPFIATGARLITYWTLPDCLVRDLPATGKLAGWLRSVLPFEPPLPDYGHSVFRMNESFLDGTMQTSASDKARPRFVYLHVAMPHAPFLFDSLFRWRSPTEINRRNPTPEAYLGYLPYTNTRVRQLITTIKKNTAGKAVILFMSDHGFRYWHDSIPSSVFFRNQNAVYFPDGDYSGFYDSISNVNQFRVVFNKLFRLDLPLLADSTILLLDKY